MNNTQQPTTNIAPKPNWSILKSASADRSTRRSTKQAKDNVDNMYNTKQAKDYVDNMYNTETVNTDPVDNIRGLFDDDVFYIDIMGVPVSYSVDVKIQQYTYSVTVLVMCAGVLHD